MDKEVYNRYRSELRHEDNLINHRISWFLVAQTLLFTALGVALKYNKTALAATVILVGFFSSLLIFVSVWAATKPFFDYRGRLEGVMQEGDSDDEYPQLSREVGTIKRGFVAPFDLPIIFGIAWLFCGKRMAHPAVG
ncbi:unnamed protein product [marine sediment metagenome]|uniref:Uncharacterized protein n=1 Tax=marine sediment metagenome TaxID=412755 RepID=X1MH33_9ZZZZ